MAVNLLNTSDYETTRATLDHSFAQWEANESAWQLESQLTTLKQALNGYEQAFHCEYGDFASLMRIRMELSDLEKNGRRKLKQTAFPTDEQRKNTFRELDQSIETLKKRDREHPCRQCPDMQQHMKWGHRWIREMREYERVQHRYESRTGSVARQFDRICSILEQLGYVKRDGTDMRLSEQGQLLRHIYSEQDIVLAEALERGMFDHLTARQLAAVLSALVFEAVGGTGENRGAGPAASKARSPRLRNLWTVCMRSSRCCARMRGLTTCSNSTSASSTSCTTGPAATVWHICCMTGT